MHHIGIVMFPWKRVYLCVQQPDSYPAKHSAKGSAGI